MSRLKIFTQWMIVRVKHPRIIIEKKFKFELPGKLKYRLNKSNFVPGIEPKYNSTSSFKWYHFIYLFRQCQAGTDFISKISTLVNLHPVVSILECHYLARETIQIFLHHFWHKNGRILMIIIFIRYMFWLKIINMNRYIWFWTK